MCDQNGSYRDGPCCTLCSCRVGFGDSGWTQHENGIRHRRNLLSSRMHGEPGHTVVSVFEDPAQLADPAPRYITKDPAARKGSKEGQQLAQRRSTQSEASCSHSRGPTIASTSSHPQGSSSRSWQHNLQQQLLKQVANLAGVGSMYQRAASRFTLGRLQQACTQVRLRCSPAAQVPSGPSVVQLEDLMVDLDHSWGPAEVAALAGLLQTQQLSCNSLHLTVPLLTYGPEAVAVVAATALVAASLRQQPHLCSFSLCLDSPAYQEIFSQGGTGIKPLPGLWGAVISTLQEVLQVNSSMRELELGAPPGVMAADDLAQLSTVLLTAPRRLRACVLMGLHARVGAESCLRRLPPEVMKQVLELALPVPGCKLVLSTPKQLEFQLEGM